MSQPAKTKNNWVTVDCDFCEGQGFYMDRDCPKCGGKGKVVRATQK